MVARRTTRGLIVAWAAVSALAAAPRLPLATASARRAGDHAPVHAGEAAAVTGTVSARAVRIIDYAHLPIQDAAGHGFILESTFATLQKYQPGDVVEAEGTIRMHAGLAVLGVASIRTTGRTNPPGPKRVSTGDLNDFQYLGVLVNLQGRVVDTGENTGGELLIVASPRERSIRVFLPRESLSTARAFASLRAGDEVRVTGFGSQYCPFAPYNRYFEVVIGDPAAVVVLGRDWTMSPEFLIAGFVLTAVAIVFWWTRERQMGGQRRAMRSLMGLAEEVVAASTPAEIARAVQTTLPTALGATDAELYLFNRANSTLDAVRPDAPDSTPLSVNSPIGGLSSAIALAFRNRAMLVIPDTRKSPLFDRDQPDLPPAAVFAPILSRHEVLGILSITLGAHREVTKDEQAAIQHVANQIATSLKLQEQKTIREQLLRSEKMAATGQLISGVASELRVPLQAIHTLAQQLAGASTQAADRDVSAIAYEAGRAANILSRLVSFDSGENAANEPVDLGAIARAMIDFRLREWESKGIEWDTAIPAEPLVVLAVRSQMEQVLMNLLVSAESAVLDEPAPRIRIAVAENGASGVAGIEFTGPAPSGAGTANEDDAVLGLQVCQAIVQAQGGELRLRSTGPQSFRFEIELPLFEQVTSDAEHDERPSRPPRMLTALIVEPDQGLQRRLMSVLAARGHRSIPVGSAEDGLDLSHRLHFDVVFSGVRLPGLNWVEFHTKVRRNIRVFVLLADGYDASLSTGFHPGEGYVLNRTLNAAEIERVLEAVESRQEAVAPR